MNLVEFVAPFDEPLDIPPLVATDLDGTLLDYRTRALPAGFEETLGRIFAAGTAFAVASGRPLPAVRLLFPRHANRIWVVSDNGAALWHGPELVAERPIPTALWEEAYAAARELPDVGAVLVGTGGAWAAPMDPTAQAFLAPFYAPLSILEDPVPVARRAPSIRKLLVYRRGGDSPEMLAFRDRFSPALSIVSAEPGFLDCMAPGVEKGGMVRELQRRLGVDPERCVCFGDWENDVGLLRSCGRSYAMRGAHPAAIAAARFIAPPCSEAGAKTVLDRLF